MLRPEVLIYRSRFTGHDTDDRSLLAVPPADEFAIALKGLSTMRPFRQSLIVSASNLSIEPSPHEAQQPFREENDHHDKDDSEWDQVRELVSK